MCTHALQNKYACIFEVLILPFKHQEIVAPEFYRWKYEVDSISRAIFHAENLSKSN